jgi:alcohol dehydrogenase
MKAVYYESFRALPVIATLPDPAPSPGGIVVKVEATGLCRSDWHGWMGHDPDIRLPHVPGHELAGTVVAAGREVRNWKAGDRVTVPFVSGCGCCTECLSGNQQVCVSQFQPGFTAWGSFADYVAIEYADSNVVRLPDSMAFETAASLGCRFVTSFRAIADQGRLRPGEWIAVHGCGGVGLSAIMIAKAMGGNVVAVDIGDDKLSLARALGADAAVNGRTTGDVPAALRDITGGGAHLSIDALGSPGTCFNSIMSLRRRGRHVQVGLMLDKHAEAPVPMSRIIAWELELRGSHGMQAWRYADMMAMIAAGKLHPEKLIGRRISLDDARAALVDMDRFAGQGITVITKV